MEYTLESLLAAVPMLMRARLAGLMADRFAFGHASTKQPLAPVGKTCERTYTVGSRSVM